MVMKKDFKAVAEIIKRNRTRIEIDDVEQLSHGLPCLRPAIIGDIADYFATQNPCFDRQKFFDACGLNS